MKGDEQTEQRKLQENTMKTSKNSQYTRSGAPSQSEQAVSDIHASAKQSSSSALDRKPLPLSQDTSTLKQYEALLIFSQSCGARVIIRAHSLAEAKEKAWEIESDEIDDNEWNPLTGDMRVDSVEPLVGGHENE